MNAKRLVWEGREKERIIRSAWNYVSMNKNREEKFENIYITYKVTRGFVSKRDIFQVFCKTFPNLLCIDADNETLRQIDFNSIPHLCFPDIIRANEYTNLIYCVVNSLRF